MADWCLFSCKEIGKKEKYDIAHHLIYVNTWRPTYMAFLGVPFIYGPIGEHPRAPYRIIKDYGWKVAFRDAIVSFARYASKKYNPLMRKIYNQASRIIVINSEIYSKMPEFIKKKTFVMPAIGAGVSNIYLDKERKEINSKFTILYVGRFVYIKVPDIALEAFLKFAKNHNDVELIMIGGGKLEIKLNEIIQSSGEAHKVKLLGWIDRKEVMEYMKRCDIFLFPTFEGGGMVVLEAMSYGKPVICLDFGGPKDFVKDECGIKIPVINRSQIINDLADALEKLYINEDLRKDMGIAARKRIEQNYTWDKKVELMNKLYKEIAENKKNDKQFV